MQKQVDVTALFDGGSYNAGFIVIKPTNNSILLYRTLQSSMSKPTVRFEQRALNSAIKKIKKSGLKVSFLNKNLFRDGRDYFENPRRYFAPDNMPRCSRGKTKQHNCAVVVHNNWIVSKAAKVYRYRENLMWMYDGDNQYYTSSTRRYLTYNNQAPTMPATGLSNVSQTALTASEISALKTAMIIGYLLNRTVILPRFHAGPKAVEVPLNYILHMTSFDKYFAGSYRENSFVRHPKVPAVVKSELSKQSFIEKIKGLSLAHQNVTILDTDIVRKFGGTKARVLAFATLHYVLITLTSNTKNNLLIEKLREAFFRSSSRQYKRWQLPDQSFVSRLYLTEAKY